MDNYMLLDEKVKRVLKHLYKTDNSHVFDNLKKLEQKQQEIFHYILSSDERNQIKTQFKSYSKNDVMKYIILVRHVTVFYFI